MYANLAVIVTKPNGKTKRYRAWRVIGHPDGTIQVHTDKNDGSSSYYEEGPVKYFPAGTSFDITADY